MRAAHLVILAMLLAASSPAAAKQAENHFASIYIDGKKAGQVHYTVEYSDEGEIETLKTDASLSVLGIKLFHFTQNLHEDWQSGELQELRGHTNDDGTIYDAKLKRGPDGYQGALNKKPIELPHNAYPASVWHYAIIDQSLLFDLKTLELMKVKVARKSETLKVGKKKIPTERFDFSGEWKATIWFDQSRQLVQFQSLVDKHEVKVTLDE